MKNLLQIIKQKILIRQRQEDSQPRFSFCGVVYYSKKAQPNTNIKYILKNEGTKTDQQ